MLFSHKHCLILCVFKTCRHKTFQDPTSSFYSALGFSRLPYGITDVGSWTIEDGVLCHGLMPRQTRLLFRQQLEHWLLTVYGTKFLITKWDFRFSWRRVWRWQPFGLLRFRGALLPLKRRSTSARLHGEISRKAVIFSYCSVQNIRRWMKSGNA
jgi:hypothetical protein